MDGSGFINPADLNSSPAPQYLEAPTPHLKGDARGTKRSRTPESRPDADTAGGSDDDDDLKPRKRGRISKGSKPPSPPATNGSASHTPKLPAQSLPRDSLSQPPQPQKSVTPGKAPAKTPATLKDITTDQLCEDKSGYIESEHDPDGENKVTDTGHLTEGREYRCRTFHLPERDHKLFMLATECAKVLVFRDSYLLFNKNKSLHKIIATLSDKEGLIAQGILPYSYRSRQIALVTARSMYRQFGAKMILEGRRVKDDYWEASAVAQGYTEEDFAVERKVAPTKPVKEGPATDVSSVGMAAMNTLAQGEVVYQKADGAAEAPAPPVSDITEDSKLSLGDYGGTLRPRHDITGPAYEDRIQPSHGKEIIDQAAQASQFNSGCAEGARNRRTFFQEFYAKPRKVVETPRPQPTTTHRQPDPAPQPIVQRYQPSPQQHRRESQQMQPPFPQQQQQQPMHQQATPSQMMGQQGFARPPHPTMPSQMQQSPTPHQQIRRDSTSSQMSQPQARPNFFNPTMGHQTPHQPPGGGGMYNPYQQQQGNQMWPSQQAQHMSPHGQPPHQPMPFQSPHPNGMGASPSPMGYPGQGMGGMGQGYPPQMRGMGFPQGGNPQQFMQQQQHPAMGQMGHGMGAPGMGYPGGMPQQQMGAMGQGWGY